jgi:hypothetical protein
MIWVHDNTLYHHQRIVGSMLTRDSCLIMCQVQSLIHPRTLVRPLTAYQNEDFDEAEVQWNGDFVSLTHDEELFCKCASIYEPWMPTVEELQVGLISYF